ncbi:hypothetical protein B566_EDAN011906 [Ephemera danica]|nr:hypothetical protein B566_EDAN011906 [Ephemera danica]
MAFMEWRRFNFFDLHRNVDSGKINEAIKEAKISSSSSGHGYLVLGDSKGNVHLVNRLFHVITFRAHEHKICLLQQLQHVGILVTVGEEESGGSIVIKVWDCDRNDKHGVPVCIRVSRYPSVTAEVTVLSVHEHKNLLALGFSDGSIMLLRGDITQERAAKMSILKDSTNSAITGLAFRTTARQTHLFVASENQVYLYNITTKDKEQKIHLDSLGCERNCSALSTDTAPESHFMIGRNDAIYCYTSDGKGPCYASVEGRKTMMQWSRNYLVIVGQDNKSFGTPSNSYNETSNICETLTVLDLQNKLMVFCAPVRGGVTALLSEWGCFFILTEDNQLLGLAEIDLQSKLAMLFKKNLYDVAIRITKSQQYDTEGLADIFRQYGDHLYRKGDHAGAIEQYNKTISKVEPSYVIRKFLDSQLIEHLTTYLQALHKQGLAREDHTTLLLNCYTKLNRTDKLREFLLTKDRELDFDVDTAIRVCRQVSVEDALMLAEKHARHDWYLKIELEDRQQYRKGLDYIAQLNFVEAEASMRKYGLIMLQHIPQETTDFLKQLCLDFRSSSKPLISQNELIGNGPQIERASPEDFIHLFLNNSKMLVEFLEHMIKVEPHSSTLVYNILVEHYLRVWGTEGKDGDVEQKHIEQKVLHLLQNPDAKYDRAQIIILCQLHHFAPGILFLYEEAKLYHHILRYHSTHEDHEALLMCCRKFGTQDPSLWVQALWACAKDSSTPPRILMEVLQVIERERLLPPLLVIDVLASSSTATLGDVRNYLLGVLRAEEELTNQEQELNEKYRTKTDAIRQQIHALQTSSVVFRGNLCNACNQPLELPSIHFLCQHSFHQHCFQSCAESEHDCPVCLPNNKNFLDIIKSQEQARTLHESFHSQLERAQDGYSLVADYFGRGVFNQLTVMTDFPKTSSASNNNTMLSSTTKSSTLTENSRPVAARVSPTPPTKFVAARVSPTPPTKSFTKITPEKSTPTLKPKVNPPLSTNPFGEDEEDSYDESKNPFAGDEPVSTNPFDEEL